MTKIVIVGSCKFAPYEIIQTPNPFDWKLYNEDHEKAYEKACEIYYPKIRAVRADPETVVGEWKREKKT